MSFTYYSPLTVNSGQVPSTQTNFPMLISLTDARFKTVANGGHVNNANGYDIRPYGDSSLTTPLYFELESYNGSTGAIIMWVNVPSIQDGTVIYLTYLDPGINDNGSNSLTWSNSYISVFHLRDGSTLSMSDSLGVHNGTNHSATATTGKIDGAGAFASTPGQWIDTGTWVGPSAITISGWINATSFPASYNDMLQRSSERGSLKVKSTGKLACFVQVIGAITVSYDGTGVTTLSPGTTYYLAMTYDSSAGLTGYVNASVDGTAAPNGALLITSATCLIGRSADASEFWNGWIDEVRLSSIARSANWITTEYNNQNAPGTFSTLGTEAPNSRGLFVI